MDSARAILQLQKSASEEELLETLQRVTEQRLKFFCNESAVKRLGIGSYPDPSAILYRAI